MTTILELAQGMGAGSRSEALAEAADEFGISNGLEQAHWLAQMAVETMHFSRFRESLNYSAAGLRNTFLPHRISDADCQKHGRAGARRANQEAIANCVYGGAWGRDHLGNTQPGDGWRFIGRGDKQLTGRDNYTRCSHALFHDDRLLDQPELLEFEPAAARSAAWFWSVNHCGPCARRDDLDGVTRIVNGGTNGLEARRTALLKAKSILLRGVA